MLLQPARALAQERTPPAAPHRAVTNSPFRYVEPVGAKPLRALIEQVGLLGLGTAQYFTNQKENRRDWDHEYSLNTLGEKLGGAHYTLDTNHFDTNFIGHQLSGTLYYIAARGNRLPWSVAYAYAAGASLIWEILGELRENTSINDLIVTPTSGLVLGESTFQLGAFLDRSCASAGNTMGGILFAPTKAIHDAIDGAQLLRDSDCDRNGLTRHGEHEFRLALGGALIFPAKHGHGGPLVESAVGLHTRVLALEEYGAPGHGRTGFAAGNLSEMWFAFGLTATYWTELGFRAAIVPVGVHWRSITGVAEGRRFGDELLLGLLLGTEYGVHRFDAHTSSQDRVFLLQAPGAAVLYRRHGGSVRFEGELQAAPTLAGIEAFGLEAYTGTAGQLPSVAAFEGYNYAGGFTVFPRARLYVPWIEMGAEVAVTRVWAITAFDRYGDTEPRLSASEGRYVGTTWMTFGPSNAPVRFSLRGRGLHRYGNIGAVGASRTEWRLGASLDAIL